MTKKVIAEFFIALFSISIGYYFTKVDLFLGLAITATISNFLSHLVSLYVYNKASD